MAAQTPLTLIQMYDTIRRMLMIVPAIDLPTPGSSGAASPSQPYPNNAAMLDALNYAIDWVNRKVRCGPIAWTASISVATPSPDLGSTTVDISTDDSNTYLIREGIDVTWHDATNGYQRLKPIPYGGYEQAFLPGSSVASSYPPLRFYVSGTTIVLFPSPQVSGTLYVTQCEGIGELVSNSDTIVGPPVSLHSTIYFAAVAILSARDATNAESLQRMQSFLALAQDGLNDIINWKQGYFATLIQQAMTDPESALHKFQQVSS
jgi:hypothetical protein